MKKQKETVVKKNKTRQNEIYPEALTNDFGLAIASNKIASVTTQPVKKGSEIYISTSLAGAPGGSYTWYVNGQPGTSVNLRLERIPNTGGHFHGGATIDTMAIGTLSQTSIALGPYPQNVQVVQKYPEVCGSINFIAIFVSNTVVNQIDVLVQGLVPINQTQSLLLKSPLSEHPSPYWGNPSFIDKLNQLSTQYFQQRKKPITVTDGCLQWGGRFDLGQDWVPPHAEHRDGHQADIRSNDMNDADKKAFLAITAAVGLNVLVEANHWHVRG